MIRHTIFLTGFLSVSLLAQAPAEWTAEIDLSQGVVDGKRALGFWPTEDYEGWRPIDPSGITVHLALTDDLIEERVFPCGTWFSPPPGRYKFWLEGAGWMSPASSVLKYGAQPFRGKGWAAIRQVVTAGKVAVAPEVELSAGQTLRLLHTESHNRGPHPMAEMSRRVKADAAQRGAAMPEGQVLAGIFDDRLQEYVALGEPIDVYHGQTARITPRSPREKADLLIVLERPALASDFEQYDVELTVGTTARGFTAPSIQVRTAERVYAVWYGLTPGTVLLEVASPSVFFAPRALVLNPGFVSSYRGSLERLPNVDVEVRLPAETSFEGELSLEVRRRVTKEPVRRLPVRLEAPSQGILRLEKLPPERLEVVLRAPPWRFVERVDLRDAKDATVFFEPSPVHVTGTVYRGDRGHPATVTFATGMKTQEGEPATVSFETDDTGSYEALLFRRGFYSVVVRLREEPPQGRAYLEATWEPVEDGDELDFRLPDNMFRVRVVDGSTGAGVRGASIGFDNRFTRESSGESNVSQRVTTDSKGRVDLPPLRQGRIELRVKAPGYRPARETRRVREMDGEQEILMRLQPEVAAGWLRLRLAHGAPADAAEAAAFPRSGSQEPVWDGRSDERGILLLPEGLDGTFLVLKHPGAGVLVRPWHTGSVDTEATWVLPEMASPLELLATRPTGEPLPWARFALWIDGLPVAGAALHWVAGKSFADRNGFLRVRQLPPAPVKVLSWAPGTAAPGLIEALAVSVAHPWNTVVEIEALQ